MGYYAARSGSFLPTIRDNLSVPFSGTTNPDTLARNVGKKLPLLAA